MRSKDLDKIYATCCTHGAPVSEGIEAPDEMQNEAERIARGIYNGSITEGNIDPKLTKLVAEHLRKAVIDGFGKDLHQLNYGTPDYNKLVQFEKNIYQFSGAKNYQQLKSLSLALKDKNGIQREYSSFKDEAIKINNAYNGRHLRTEFDTAVCSGQMGAQWVDIQAHKDIYPYLEFDAVMDSKTTDLCRRLNGTLVPVDSAFVKIYFPPNHFNERLTVRQRSSGVVTQNLPDADIPDIFRTNLAESGFIFPEKHAYYIGCPPDVLAKALLLRENIYSKIPKTPLMKKNVWVGSLADQREVEHNITQARRLAEHNEEVYIRPHSNVENVKNYELQLGASSGDFKTDERKTTIERFVRNAIKSANNQHSNIPVLVIDSDRYNKNEIWRAMYGELKHTKDKKMITDVWLLLDDSLIKVKRENIFKGINELP